MLSVMFWVSEHGVCGVRFDTKTNVAMALSSGEAVKEKVCHIALVTQQGPGMGHGVKINVVTLFWHFLAIFSWIYWKMKNVDPKITVTVKYYQI